MAAIFLLRGARKELPFVLKVRVQSIRTVPKRRLPVPPKEKRLDIVILGAPNAGKSVLLNTMLKTKLAAASRKRHTTRREILGVVNHRNTQLAIFDTPGFVKDTGSKSQAMKASTKQLSDIAVSSVKEKADVVLIVVDALRVRPAMLAEFADMIKLALTNAKQEIILVLNKVDLVNPKVQLLESTRTLVSIINGIKLGPEKEHLAQLDTTTFMISALKNDGVIDITNYLISIAEFKPWIIPRDAGVITDLSHEERIEEMILQTLMEHTHEEIPYIADVECKSIERLTDRRIKVEVDIRVDTPSQQKIVIGQHGRTLVKIRQSASENLEAILEKEVILYLWVNLRKG